MRVLFVLFSIFGAVALAGDVFAKNFLAFSEGEIRKKPISTHQYDASSVTGNAHLTKELDQIISENKVSADIAVFVKSMRSGDTLYTLNIHTPMTPASVLKVLTAEAALLYLGPNYRFATQVLTDAKTIKNGVLEGNLYIALSGDPTLTYYDLVELLVSLKSQQISAISGNVYIDNSAYDQHFYGPGWDDKDKKSCYAAPISASIINYNCLSFKVAPAKTLGRAAQVVTFPQYFYPSIKNAVVTKPNRSKGCSLHLTTTPDRVITVDGCMPRGPNALGVSYVITDIPEYNRLLFKNLLKRLAIDVRGSIKFGIADNNLSLIGQHASEPLRVLISEMLKKSNNIIAGALFKKMGQLYTKKPGSWENGSYAVTHILAKKASVNTTGMKVLDGSGISPDNATTPAQMMQVLDFAYHHYPTSYDFVSSLPIAGVDGTLKHRMSNIARKVRAKTGTISGVVSLAGYALSADKEPLAFVIMVNGNKGLSWQYKSMEDQIATTLTHYHR